MCVTMSYQMRTFSIIYGNLYQIFFIIQTVCLIKPIFLNKGDGSHDP